MKLSIRARITLWYVGCFSIVFLAVGWFVYNYLENTVEHYEEYEEHNEIIEDLIEDALEDLFVALLVSLPLMLLAAAMGGWIVTSAALKPVDRLTKAACEITAQNLTARLPVPTTQDEIARLSSTLNDMISRLELALEEAKRFSANASHELRTPLTIMQGEIEVTLQKPRSLKDYTKTLGFVLEEIHGLRRLTENLLTLSRADRGEWTLANETVDLAALTQATVEEAVFLAADKSQILHFEPHPLSPIRGDRHWLKHLLLNLLDNAVSYSPEHSRITVRCFSCEGFCGVEVTDSGPGIPPEERVRVFDRFYRHKSSGFLPGKSGLGLAICKWIVEHHQGEIEILDAIPKGTTVRISFPKAD